MNMKLLLPLIAALALTPLFARQHGFSPNLSVGNVYTSDWQVGTHGEGYEQGGGFECVAGGADLVRRAAPPLIGASVRPYGSIDLKPRDPAVCASS